MTDCSWGASRWPTPRPLGQNFLKLPNSTACRINATSTPTNAKREACTQAAVDQRRTGRGRSKWRVLAPDRQGAKNTVAQQLSSTSRTPLVELRHNFKRPRQDVDGIGHRVTHSECPSPRVGRNPNHLHSVQAVCVHEIQAGQRQDEQLS